MAYFIISLQIRVARSVKTTGEKTLLLINILLEIESCYFLKRGNLELIDVFFHITVGY